ncbi:ABC transporter permease [Turicibacter sp. TJ11]|uniref:ABC transporter permease n=1 Tax=Turicibacter sp. TJ11 TaxID=2806443 RepID=UPI001F2938DE|nr:ABC transporter permease [Turicibacter sp. TJ11]
MKHYMFKRFLRSLFSIFMVLTIVFTLIYSVIPRDRVFFLDSNVEKIQKRPDDYANYKYVQWEKLGYLNYETIQDYCKGLYGTANEQYSNCILPESKETSDYIELKQQQGWETFFFEQSRQAYAVEEISVLRRAINWWVNLIEIDYPGKVQTQNENLERQVYVGKDFNGRPALMCSGCESKYLLYFNGSFPYIHQNFIRLNLGTSYPTYSGQEVLEVVSSSQGEKVKQEVTMPNGEVKSSSINFYTCKYKETLDSMDQKNFTDHYADCETIKSDPSMIHISFSMGLVSLLLTYIIGLPIGIQMANHKGKWIDKLGQWYIIFMNAIPALAYIVLVRFIGGKYFGLPSMFPMLGANDYRSYILPIISLTLGSVAGRMMWMRRYMIDQSTMDYVKFARAKGLSENEIFFKHIFRNAIGPIAHGIPAAVILCISGALITEGVYSIPGMGKILPDSISIYNNSMVVGLTFIFTVLSILSTFLGDWLLTLVDPRISLEEKGGH